MKLDGEAEAQKATLAAHERTVQTALDGAHQDMLDRLAIQIEALTGDMQAMYDAGSPAPISWLLQQNRMSSLMNYINADVNLYGAYAQLRTTDLQREVVAQGQQDATNLMQTVLEPGATQLGVDLTYARPPIEAMQAMAGRASNGAPLATLFEGFGAEAAQAAKSTLLLATSLGTNPRQIAEQLANDLGVSRNRAMVIARTEGLGAYRDASLATFRENSDVVGGWMWLCTLSARTCAECLSMDGQVFELDTEFDSHPQCFPAGTLVSGPRPVGSTTRWYVGEMVEIETVGGHFLRVTPNHPILTPRGWVAAGLLEVGSDVISHGRAERGHAAPVADPHDDDVPAPIEQVAVTLRGAGAMSAVRMPAAAEDFHGDGRGSINREVHVVGANRILRDAGEWRYSWPKPLAQQQLCRRHAQLALLASLSDPHAVLNGPRLAAYGRMGSLTVAHALLGSASSGQGTIDFRRAPDGDAGSFQATTNGRARCRVGIRQGLFGHARKIADDDFTVRQRSRVFADRATGLNQQATDSAAALVEHGRQLLERLAGLVEADQIIRIERSDFEGHVYNLQTAEQWYIANGIIAHNCRCTQVPLTRGWGDILSGQGVDASEFEDAGTLDELDAEVEDATLGRQTGTDWFNAQDDATQAEIVGKAGQQAIAAGEIELKDFVGVRQDPVWGTTRYQKSLKEALTPNLNPAAVERIKSAFGQAADEFNAAMRGEAAYTPSYAVTYASEAHQAAMAAKLGRDLTPDELAGLTAAPAGSQIAVKAGTITSTYPDGSIMSVYLSGSRAAGDLSVDLQGLVGADGALVAPYSAEQIQQVAQSAQDLGIDTLQTKGRTWTAGAFDDYKRLPEYGFDAPIEGALHESQFNPIYGADRAPPPPESFTSSQTLSEALQHPDARAWWDQYGNAPRLVFDNTPGSSSLAQLDTAVADEAARSAAAIAESERAAATFSTERMSADQLEQETTRLLNSIAPHGTVSDTAVAAKKQIAHDLAARLADNPTFMQVGDRLSQLMANDADLAREYRAFGALNTPEDVAGALMHSWASGTDSLFPALQRAIKDEFGLTDLARASGTKAAREALAQWADVQPGLRAFVRAMYNNTQEWLRANDISEAPLYRGMGFIRLPKAIDGALLDGQPHDIQIALRAASSFSADARTAWGFSSSPVSDVIDDLPSYQMVIAARVPAALILSTPQTGFGALGEYEVVTLGGTFDVTASGVDNAAFYRGPFEDIAHGVVTKHDLTVDQVAALLAQPVENHP